MHSVPVVESKTGLACVSRSQDYLHNRYISRCNVRTDVLCVYYLLGIGITDALSRASNEGRGKEREGRREKKESEKERGEERRKKNESWKWSRAATWETCWLSEFLRAKEAIIKVKEKLKVEKRSILRCFDRWT